MRLDYCAVLLAGFLLPGIGPHSCAQYDDTGRLELHIEGLPPPNITMWIAGPQTTPMPDYLAGVLQQIPPCLPGKNHS